MWLLRWVTFALASAAITICTSAQAAPRFDMVVRGDFFAGLTGDPARLQKAMEACERALEADPKAAEALVWHGAGLYFQAGEAFRAGDGGRGIALATRGRKEMDDAVALEPDNLGVLIPRAATLLEAARRMDPDSAKPLLKQAVGDYERVLAVQQPVFATLGDHAKGELLFGLADGWARLGDLEKSRAYFERITRDAAGSARATESRERLSSGVAPAGPVARCSGCHA